MVRIIFLAIVFLGLFPATAFSSEVRISPASGATPIVFDAEIMRSREEKAQGLMYKRALPKSSAMVFEINPPSKVRFWMRNTFIPLDMIFVDGEGFIDEIVSRYDTESDDITASKKPVGFVIEVNAGTATEMGIQLGDKVEVLD